MEQGKRRTTRDLVTELRGAAHAPDRAILAVGFEKRTEFVDSDDAAALTKLNDYVSQGGEPMGIVTIHRDAASKFKISAHPVAEHEGEQWVEKYLITMTATVRDGSREIGGDAGPIRT